jgi:ribosomal protein L37AE/L43A
MDYEREDRIALYRANLAMLICPRCRASLDSVALLADVWGCGECRETWHLPTEVRGQAQG